MIEPTDQTQAQVAAIDAFRHPDKQLVFNHERLGVLVNPEGFERSILKRCGVRRDWRRGSGRL